MTWQSSLMAPEMALPPRIGERHGTRSRYTLGCRCDICRTMHAILHARFGQKTPSSPGHQRRAHNIVERAVRAGTLVPPDRCSACLKTPRARRAGQRSLEAHHGDYGAPLDVVWLCKPCHVALHKEQKAEGAAFPLARAATPSDTERVPA